MRSSRTRKKQTARVLLLPGFEWCPAGAGWCVAVAGPSLLVEEKAVDVSVAGSRLFLEEPEFLAALGRGCPVRFLLKVYNWPVRSAVVLCLCRVFLGGGGAVLRVPAVVRKEFVRACMTVLGYSVSGRAPAGVCLEWLSKKAIKPKEVPVFHGVASVSGVTAGLRMLSRGLFWLARRDQKCPGAVRSAVALLGALVAATL